MIVFAPTSALPRPLTEAHVTLLGSVIGRRLRTKSVRQVGVRFVTPKAIQSLNKLYRGKDRPTDVLSFESQTIPLPKKGQLETALGDLVICPSYAAAEAKRRKLPPLEEYLRLLTHGVLHLSGYDHVTEEEELKMFAIQEFCVEKVMSSL